MAAETIVPSSRAAQRAQTGQQEFLKRWLVTWVVLLTVVTLVVVVFLVTITNSLASITTGLEDADEGVGTAGTNVKALHDQVDAINGSLAEIDPVLQPIPSQVDSINGALGSIDTKLKRTDGSLRDTSGVLRAILSQAGDIRGMLADADDPPDRLGVQAIHQRVAFANGTGNTGPMGVNPGNLAAAEADARNILAGLVDSNKHLNSICNSQAVQAQNRPRC